MENVVPFPQGDSEDAVLNRVLAMWAQADTWRNEADDLEYEASRLRGLAEEKLDEAEDAYAPLVVAHPEWEQFLRDGTDPCDVIAEAAFDQAEYDRTGE